MIIYVREGSHLRLFDKMGAHWIKHEGAQASISPSGRRMPSASPSSAISTTGTAAAMSCAIASGAGIWEIFAPDVPTGVRLQIRDPRPGRRMLLPLKADPFARRSELRPKTASVTAPELLQEWEDEAHLKHWSEDRQAPSADLHLRGACRLLAAARRRHVPVLGRTGLAG